MRRFPVMPLALALAVSCLDTRIPIDPTSYSGTYDATISIDGYRQCSSGSSGCGVIILTTFAFPVVVHATFDGSTVGATPAIDVRDVTCTDPAYCAQGSFLGYASGHAAPYEQQGTTSTFADLASTPQMRITMSATQSTWLWMDQTLSGTVAWIPVPGSPNEYYKGTFTATRRP